MAGQGLRLRHHQGARRELRQGSRGWHNHPRQAVRQVRGLHPRRHRLARDAEAARRGVRAVRPHASHYQGRGGQSRFLRECRARETVRHERSTRLLRAHRTAQHAEGKEHLSGLQPRRHGRLPSSTGRGRRNREGHPHRGRPEPRELVSRARWVAQHRDREDGRSRDREGHKASRALPHHRSARGLPQDASPERRQVRLAGRGGTKGRDRA